MDDEVFIWQIGENDSLSPNLPKIYLISCGLNFTTCVDYKGFMWSFGLNTAKSEQEIHPISIVPQKIEEFSPVRSVSCGYYHINYHHKFKFVVM